MCYSAQVYADWKKFTRMFGARMFVGEFYRTFWTRNDELPGDDDDVQYASGDPILNSS